MRSCQETIATHHRPMVPRGVRYRLSIEAVVSLRALSAAPQAIPSYSGTASVLWQESGGTEHLPVRSGESNASEHEGNANTA
jgi:hypothetical protein